MCVPPGLTRLGNGFLLQQIEKDLEQRLPASLLLQLAERAFVFETAEVQQAHAIAQVGGFIQPVRADHDRFAPAAQMGDVFEMTCVPTMSNPRVGSSSSITGGS